MAACATILRVSASITDSDMPRRKKPEEHFPTSIRMPKELVEFYKGEAERERRSFSYVVLDVLETHKAYMTKARKRNVAR